LVNPAFAAISLVKSVLFISLGFNYKVYVCCVFVSNNEHARLKKLLLIFLNTSLFWAI